MTTIAEARAQTESFMQACRGLMGARDDEWLAGYRGFLPSCTPIYGTFERPQEDEPMLVRFTDGQKWTNIMAVQRLSPGLYMNCVCGTVFDWDDDLLVVYSALSRQGEEYHLVTNGP